MSWIPPFFTCGLCGGEIGRWPSVNLLKQEVALWRHRTVGEGWGEHQAVLGTPAHEPQVPPPTKPKRDHDEVVEPDVAPPPVVPAREAQPWELPASASRWAKAARENGWDVRAWYMQGPLMTAAWKFSRMIESVVVKAQRDGHLLVAVWQSNSPGAPAWAKKDWPGTPYVESFNPWKFDSGWSVGHYVDPLTSPELTAARDSPRALCESCDEPPALHVSTATGPVCHNEWLTQREKEA